MNGVATGLMSHTIDCDSLLTKSWTHSSKRKMCIKKSTSQASTWVIF